MNAADAANQAKEKVSQRFTSARFIVATSTIPITTKPQCIRKLNILRFCVKRWERMSI